MNARCLYIIMCIVSLLFLTDCKDEEAVRSSEGKRTITVNLGIAMSRVNLDDTDLGKGTPSDMKVWIFEHDTDNRLAYLPEDKPVFSGSDALGGLVNTKEYVVEVDNSIQALDFYVVLNSGNGTDLDLDENSTPSKIKEATFTGISTGLEDNQVPAYGSLENFDVSEHKNTYTVPSIELTRTVGKLELFFTKENANSYLMINGIKLEHVPDKGYLNGEYTPTDVAYRGNDVDNLITAKTLIETVSSEDFGSFSEDETHFTKLDLTQDYLLENPYGGTWSEVGGNNDYTYTDPYDPDKQSDADYTDGNIRYKMTVTYQTAENGEEKKQVVYLPEIKRNYWNKIFARVKDDGKFVLSYRVLLWEEVKSQIGWNPPIQDGGNAPVSAWRLVKFDENDDDSPRYIDSDYKDAREGDEEAVFCYVLYPRYDSEKDDKGDAKHEGLENKPSYAAFNFHLSEPEGAVWKAWLSNTTDFSFGSGEYTVTDVIEKENGDKEPGETHTRRCAITGIARDEDYQIQVTANHAWTDLDYQNTSWGQGVEESNREVYTDLHISISTDGGETWYDLAINKEDKAEQEDGTDYLEHTYWNGKRRFAGGNDYYIRIWQLRPAYSKGFDQLIKDLPATHSLKDWWKGDDSN